MVELEECRRWANSDAGQIARIENPAGFANVRAHAEAHLRAIGLAYAAANASGIRNEAAQSLTLIRPKTNNPHKNKHYPAKKACRHWGHESSHPHVDIGHGGTDVIQQRTAKEQEKQHSHAATK